MDPTQEPFPDNGSILGRFARRLLSLGENRLELLTLEVQEARDRMFRDFLLALAVAGFAWMALLAGSAAFMVRFWTTSPVAALLGLMGFHAMVGAGLLLRLLRRLRQWQALPDSLEQIRRDRQCIDRLIP
ncbi:MAG: putative Actinobacterial Holin-X, holin superfamily [Verrucomicrobiota bacterium]|jgi:uncharacterized membrane protein YqjE